MNRQLLQDNQNGQVLLLDLDAPQAPRGGVLVATAWSVVSVGTDRRSLKTAKASLMQKARLRPDLVRQVLANARREGLRATFHKVQDRLQTLVPLGNSCSGLVLSSDCGDFRPGDRVACAGVGYASHAEFNAVPRNLCVKVPDDVDLRCAAFGTLGAIALQGVRQAEVRMGDTVAVLGVGLLGLISVFLLKRAGCRVICADLHSDNDELALALGAERACRLEDLAAATATFSRGGGADAVLLAASTPSHDPLRLAAEIARRKARLVVLGDVGLHLEREPHFYKKELELSLSCAYGPGRYDPRYEEEGQDYPREYVRYTAQRNIETFLDQLRGDADFSRLIREEHPLEEAPAAYDRLVGASRTPLGVLIRYPQAPLAPRPAPAAAPSRRTGRRVGLIGAGNFSTSYLLPPLLDGGEFELAALVNAHPHSAAAAARKLKVERSGTDPALVLEDPAIDSVVVATRHDSHGHLAARALAAGKDLFIEKPLCLDPSELLELESLLERPGCPRLLVGYNRRFSPMAQRMKAFLAASGEPLQLLMRVNAGFLPASHWAQQATSGGGRLLGEVCHFVDLALFLSGSPLTEVAGAALPDAGRYSGDNLALRLGFQNGAQCQIAYTAMGSRAMEKECVEGFAGGRSARLLDFRQLELFGDRTEKSSAAQDKGHRAEVLAWRKALASGGPSPIAPADLLAVSAATFALGEAIACGLPTTIANWWSGARGTPNPPDAC